MERILLNNIIFRLFCRLRILRLFCLSRDSQFKSLIERLQSAEFDFARFEKIIQYRPRKWELFLHALLHRSYLPFIDEKLASNERLEFLGDAILNFVVAEQLFKKYPDMEEGNLTKIRSRLVNRKTLAQRTKDMHLSDFLLLSTSASQSIDKGAESIIADAFESIVGALYLDGGLSAAQKFICTSLLKNPEVFNSALTDDNYKSALLEYSQARSLGIPRYVVIREEGPEHGRRFIIEACIGAQSFGVGSGRSKKEAEQAAAAEAIERLQKESPNFQPKNDYAVSTE